MINDLAVSARSGRSKSEFYVCLSIDTWYLKIQVHSRTNLLPLLVFIITFYISTTSKKLQFISARSGRNCQIPYREKLHWQLYLARHSPSFRACRHPSSSRFLHRFVWNLQCREMCKWKGLNPPWSLSKHCWNDPRISELLSFRLLQVTKSMKIRTNNMNPQWHQFPLDTAT